MLKSRQILRCVLHAFGFDRLTNLCAAECSTTVLCQLVENGNGQLLFFYSDVHAITLNRVMNFVYWCYEFFVSTVSFSVNGPSLCCEKQKKIVTRP